MKCELKLTRVTMECFVGKDLEIGYGLASLRFLSGGRLHRVRMRQSRLGYSCNHSREMAPSSHE